MVTSWAIFKKADVSMTLNGVLAGLVAITAPCAFVSPPSAAIIGVLGGVAVVLAVILIDKVGVDDPVGAVSVHGVCGALGTVVRRPVRPGVVCSGRHHRRRFVLRRRRRAPDQPTDRRRSQSSAGAW